MAESQAPTLIGIAVVEHQGKFLVGRRPLDAPLAGQSEFPGGKCLSGETTGLCARRECLEETGLQVVNVDLLMRRTFVYPHGSVDLSFWLCRPVDSAAVQEDHQGYRWVPRSELQSLDFPEANAPLVAVLSQWPPSHSLSPHTG